MAIQGSCYKLLRGRCWIAKLDMIALSTTCWASLIQKRCCAHIRLLSSVLSTRGPKSTGFLPYELKKEHDEVNRSDVSDGSLGSTADCKCHHTRGHARCSSTGCRTCQSFWSMSNPGPTVIYDLKLTKPEGLCPLHKHKLLLRGIRGNDGMGTA